MQWLGHNLTLKISNYHVRLYLGMWKKTVNMITVINFTIGHYWVHFSLYFKVSLYTSSLLWISVFNHIEIRIINIKILHLDSLWKRDWGELGNGLLGINGWQQIICMPLSSLKWIQTTFILVSTGALHAVQFVAKFKTCKKIKDGCFKFQKHLAKCQGVGWYPYPCQMHC